MKQEKIRYKYPSNRNLVYGKKGMAATSHPLAAEAGLSIMRDGGNAIDAAVAMAAALTVLEPTSNGIGGDAFAIFSKDNQIYGLNASGPAFSILVWIFSIAKSTTFPDRLITFIRHLLDLCGFLHYCYLYPFLSRTKQLHKNRGRYVLMRYNKKTQNQKKGEKQCHFGM
jgi:hypothetical protein